MDRLYNGLWFVVRCGVVAAVRPHVLRQLCALGWVAVSGDRVAITCAGRAALDTYERRARNGRKVPR